MVQVSNQAEVLEQAMCICSEGVLAVTHRIVSTAWVVRMSTSVESSLIDPSRTDESESVLYSANPWLRGISTCIRLA